MRKITISILLLVCIFFVNMPTYAMTETPSENQQTGGGNSVFLPLITGGSPSSANYDVRVNVPYFSDDAALHDNEAAIFWFGRVTASENYADIRFAYDNNKLWVYMAAFDQYMWYDETPSSADLTAWDGATLQIDLDGNTGSSPDGSSYRFDAAMSWGDQRSQYQAAYRWQNGQWVKSTVNFTSLRGYRGAFNDNNQGARGWVITYQIPFTSLGLSGRPADGTVWGASLIMHDRDSAGGPALADKSWPGGINATQPSTWAQLRYGLPNYGAIPGNVTGSDLIRRDTSRGIDVPDAGLGGTTPNLCPGDESYIFNTWGNYSGYGQHVDFNIQNQSDVSDFPCFSKYYITFPLGTIPANKTILSARLILHHQGSAGDPGQAKPSLIQVLTISGDWSENTISWNNAPAPKENISRTWVDVPIDNNNWPKDAIYWDVTAAASWAYLARQPLRLALYEADSEYHSGKYFTSSESEDWNINGRPALEIKWGN